MEECCEVCGTKEKDLMNESYWLTGHDTFMPLCCNCYWNLMDKIIPLIRTTHELVVPDWETENP